jgi:ATP-dependent Clp protease, protease subunit
MNESQVVFFDSMLPESNKFERSIGRIVYVYGEFDPVLTKECVASILELVAENQQLPIALLIDSFGGDVDSLLSLTDFIDSIPNDVHTIVMGKAMSAAAYLAMLGKKGFRYAFKNARFMTHEVLGGQQGYSTLTEHQNEIQELKNIQDILNSMVIKATNIKKSEVKKYISGQDYYMSATEAKNLGFIDIIIDKKSMKEIIQLFLIKSNE